MKQSKSGLKASDFEKVVNGKTTGLYTLTNANGAEVCITNYGGFVASIMVPDRNGKLTDVVLGHSSIDDYLNAPEKYLGSAIGRYGNRIAKGKFVLDGKTYKLAINNGPNNLHGGNEGFNRKVWNVVSLSQSSILLSYISPDGEEGFPGTLTTFIEYTLADDNALEIYYRAITDRPTIVNLTNHAFFNLSGQGEPTICDHEMVILADYFTPVDKVSIPTGEIAPVKDTPMDFRKPTTIGERIDQNYKQLIYGKGYDHCYVIKKRFAEELALCAITKSPKTGIVLETYTTEPGVQLYTGNWLSGFKGKHNAKYPERSAFCLETQHFPDSPNKPHFPSCVLRPGQEYEQICVYKFSVD